MKMMKKLLALVLTGALATGVLSGCGSQEQPAPQPEPFSLETLTEPVEYVSGLAPNTVVGSVGEYEITADMLMYWFNYTINYTGQQYASMGMTDIDWGADMGEGVTVAQAILNSALELSAYYTLLPQMAEKEYGLSPDPADMATVESDMAEAEAHFGSAVKAEHYMWLNMTTEEFYRNLVASSSLEMKLQETLFGPGGEYEATDAQVLAYAEQQGYYGAKHILLMTQNPNEFVYDDAGNPIGYATLSDDEIAQKKALAEKLLGQLNSSKDPIALFDSLMNEYSEDTGLAAYPDGYTATPGQMVAPFENAAKALKEGEISGIVESDFGYHIIQRIPLDPAGFKGEYITFRADELAQGWLQEKTVTHNEAFESIEPVKAIENLFTMQDAIYLEIFPEVFAEPETPADDAPAADTP